MASYSYFFIWIFFCNIFQILFCRNFWPYIKSTEERVDLLHKLTGKLKDNGLLVTGNYDDTVELGKILSEEGFTRVKGLPHVYETN